MMKRFLNSIILCVGSWDSPPPSPYRTLSAKDIQQLLTIWMLELLEKNR